MEEQEKSKKNLYDKHYKTILILPLIFLSFSIVYLTNFNSTNGDIILKDVSLTGGTTITVLDPEVDIKILKDSLNPQFPDLSARSISNIGVGGQQAFFVETSAEVEEIKQALENYLGYALNNENSSIEFSGASLSQGFYKQLRFAILLAFFFMAVVVFLVFRNLIPSLAVILSAFADIVMTITFVNILGIHLSTAGIIAILMLIGYSVDTDILLTTRLLKDKDKSLNERMKKAFKTGMTMTITSILAIGATLLIISSFSEVLRQMFTILLIGLCFDIFNTWTTNASLLKWYIEAKK